MLHFHFSDFYKGGNGLSRSYILKPNNCRPGIFCAALYENSWHRATLTHVDFETDQFRVFYVDYGSLADRVSVSDLRYLDKRFAQFPRQAFEFRLSGVKPLSDAGWTVEVGEKFLEIVSKAGEQGLVAKIEHIDKGSELIVASLFDTVTNDFPEGIDCAKALIGMNVAAKDSTPYIPLDMMPRPKPTRSEIPNSNTCRLPTCATVVSNLIRSFGKDKLIEDQKLSGEKSSVSTSMPTAAFESARGSTPMPSDKDWRIQTCLLNGGSLIIHLIIMNGKGYMTTAEISSLFPAWKGQDLLVRMLKLNKHPFTTLTVNQSDHRELFEQCLM